MGQQSGRELIWRFLSLWLGLCLLGLPVAALEIHTERPPEKLAGQFGNKGLSLDGFHLRWWDLDHQTLIKVLPESPCSGPVPWIYSESGPPDGSQGKIYSAQEAGLLYTWCAGDGVFSRWDISTGRLQQRTSLEQFQKVEDPDFSEFAASSELPTLNCSSDKGSALLRYRYPVLRLFDLQGKMLAETEFNKAEGLIDQCWMGKSFLAEHFSKGDVTLRHLPDLKLTRRFNLPPEEQILGLTDNWLVSTSSQAGSPAKDQAKDLSRAQQAKEEHEQATAQRNLSLHLRDLQSGQLVGRKRFEGVRDVGLAGNQIWILQADQVQIIEQLTQAPHKLTVPKMDQALLNQTMGVVWSAQQLCSLDLKAGKLSACVAFKSPPDHLFLAGQQLYVGRPRLESENNWDTIWQTYKMPGLQEQGLPQNLSGRNDSFDQKQCSDHALVIQNGLELLTLEGPRVVHRWQAFESPRFHAIIGPSTIAVWGIREELRSYDLKSGKLVGTFRSSADQELALLSADQQLIALSADPLQPMLQFYSLPDFKRVAELNGPEKLPEHIAAGEHFLATVAGQTLQLWDVAKHVLLDSIEVPVGERISLQIQANQVLYQCVEREETDKVNSRHPSMWTRSLRFQIENQKLKLTRDLKSNAYPLKSVTWQGRYFRAGNSRFEPPTGTGGKWAPAPAGTGYTRLAATWPEVILQDQGNSNQVRILTSLEPDVKARLIPENFPVVNDHPDYSLRFRDGVLAWFVEGKKFGRGLDLRTGKVRNVRSESKDFPFENDPVQQEKRHIGQWTLSLEGEKLMAKNPSQHLRQTFQYPLPLKDPTDQVDPIVWLDGPDTVLIAWREGLLLQRCSLSQGTCMQQQSLPLDFFWPKKLGNRLFAYEAEIEPSEGAPVNVPTHCILWMWDTTTLEVLQRVSVDSCPGFSELSPPGTVTLRNNWGKPDALEHQRILRLSDGKILAHYYSFASPAGLVIITEEGYYAGYGDYLDLAYLVEGEKVMALKDFPQFHRPDLVWQVLQGKPLGNVPRMPGLRWDKGS